VNILENEQQHFMGNVEVTDEMRIQFAVDEFYEFMKTFDGSKDKIQKARLQRNNILNMTDTYLKKFNNDNIMQDFYNRLIKAQQNAVRNGRLNKYTQWMNEIRVIQEFKGIQENIAEKLADQLFDLFKNSPRVPNHPDGGENTDG
jgi:hypothetical protein